MKHLLLTCIICLSLTGCYTMLHPPVEELTSGYDLSDSILAIPDSISGNGVVIINQNQIIFDRYYQDPYYQRYGYYGVYDYWDPYYYNPYKYHHNNYWYNGRYRSGKAPGTVTPKQKTPRREDDYRRSEAPSDKLPQTDLSNNTQVYQTASTYRRLEPVQQAQSEPEITPKVQITDPDSNRRTLRSVSAPDNDNQPDSTDDKQDDKTPRRGNTRER
ncbi:hypothetical protein K9N50_07350 [bacterium]|nr:hypothetical protein [bacterium]